VVHCVWYEFSKKFLLISQLAQEIHVKMNNLGIKCKLVTGQQRIEPEGAEHTSCTVEMADMNKSYDVGVIDEIQMIGSPDRGWAWTRALLGLPVKELHLCGDPSTLALIQRISTVANEEVDVKKFFRIFF
jgi:ATP-dependent RNA helicase SUPV3L1/SUV3